MAGKGGLVFTLRKHRKKAAFAAGVFCFGLRYATQRYREYLIRREYFIEAKKYGEELISPLEKPRRVYVILNPVASNGKCKALFQKNAAPILNLAGIDVTFIQADYEGHAKTIVNYFDRNVDGVVVAGGDGIMQEVLTGMLRQPEEENVTGLPIGFIPLGNNSNFLYRKFFSSDAFHVRSICKAAMAVVKGYSKETSVLEIVTDKKPVFALSNINFGAQQQVKEKIDAGKFWLLGPFKKYFAFMWRTIKNWPSFGDVRLSSSQFEDIVTNNFCLYLNESNQNPCLLLQNLENEPNRIDFIKFGWDWLRNQFSYTPNENSNITTCEEVIITPDSQDLYYGIDGEIFDARPITVRVHSRKLNVFCNSDI